MKRRLQFRFSSSTDLLAVVMMMLMGAPSPAQTRDPRVVAAVGPAPAEMQENLWETTIAAWEDDDIAENAGVAYVFAVGPDDDGDGVMDACVCTGDITGDWIVDQADLAVLLSDYGGAPNDPKADLDGDGWITQQDLGILLAQYGALCP